jgi:hypothetical protein
MSSQWLCTASSRSAMNAARWPPADYRHRIHEPWLELLDPNAQDAGGAHGWATGSLDPVGDRVPQAGVADALELAGRSQPGLDLADGHCQGPGGGDRVGQGTAGISADLPSLGEFLVRDLGSECSSGHGRLPGGVGRRGACRSPKAQRRGPSPVKPGPQRRGL